MDHIEQSEEAPDFGPGYPSGGERIGPAWQCAWTVLGDGAWHTSREIVASMIALPGAINPKTAGALLRKAADHELIERMRSTTRGERVSYRRIITREDGS